MHTTQCKNRYRNQSQLLDVARGYVYESYPRLCFLSSLPITTTTPA